MSLSDRLQQLVEEVPAVDFGEIQARARMRLNRKRTISVAALAVAGLPVAALLFASVGSGPRDNESLTAAGPGGREATTQQTSTRTGIVVSVSPSQVGDLQLSVGPVLESGEGRRSHVLRLENITDHTIYVSDSRSAAALGDPPALIAADPGCGYSLESPDGPAVPGGCRLPSIPLTIAPHAIVEIEITLFLGLPGLSGDFGGGVFLKTISWRTDRPFNGPGDADTVQSAPIEISYHPE